ncbi:hypothetical protein [Chryseobacterium sp. SIMBA_029]|uniref:hypothetical protein n=1 Tax=Chryseobacterium sp. SIMBA_029 TaxID=3085772 RepID=UPI0039788C15
MKNKSRTKIRISDEWNRDFSKMISNAKLHLKNVHEVDMYSDKRKGTLIKRTENNQNGNTVITEQWKPERTTDFKWEMVYDRYNRTVADIYYRDKGI